MIYRYTVVFNSGFGLLKFASVTGFLYLGPGTGTGTALVLVLSGYLMGSLGVLL